MIERILVGLDGSEGSQRAADAAAELASKLGAILYLVNVVHPLGVLRQELDIYAQMEHLADGAAEAAEYLAPDYMSAARDRALSNGVKEVHIDAVLGEPAEAIVNLIPVRQIDLVVVGSRGRSQLSGLLLGSVSQKLAAHAPCAALIVR
jgi:nucleotide-binding universal stress UspA family protein